MKLLLGVLLGLYVLVFLRSSMAMDVAGVDNLRVSRRLVSFERVNNGERQIGILPVAKARDGSIPFFGIYPQKSIIAIIKGDTVLERFEFDDGAGLDKCKEWVRTNFPAEAAVYINKYFDDVLDELGF